MSKPLYIDLFAGCGGLSLGLERAGFELALAVEKSDMASETYFHNFISRELDSKQWKEFCNADVSYQVSQKLLVGEVAALLNNTPILKKLRNAEIDLLAGGPPCQGFSMAGRRNPNDVRNKLPWQFLKVVHALQPKVILIENVVGMSRDFLKHNKESPFNQLKSALEAIKPGYIVQQFIVNAMHYGVAQHRPRVMLLALRKDIAKNYKFSDTVWKSEYDNGELSINRPDIIPAAKYFGENVHTVRHALFDLDDNGYRFNKADAAYKRKTGLYAKTLRVEDSWLAEKFLNFKSTNVLTNHRLRKHSEPIQNRFRIYQVLRDHDIRPSALNIPTKYNAERARGILIELLKPISGKCIAPDDTIIAKSRTELVDLIMELSTKKHSQAPLDWNKPAPTVLSIPDDHVHPTFPRTLTVRELARFQSFPDNFVFRSKETTGSDRRKFEIPQYTQVGNAIPPLLAEEVGKKIMEILKSSSQDKKSNKTRLARAS